jgi:hypothetical protein
MFVNRATFPVKSGLGRQQTKDESEDLPAKFLNHELREKSSGNHATDFCIFSGKNFIECGLYRLIIDFTACLFHRERQNYFSPARLRHSGGLFTFYFLLFPFFFLLSPAFRKVRSELFRWRRRLPRTFICWAPKTNWWVAQVIAHWQLTTARK